MTRRRGLRLAAVGLLAVWLALFSHAETTDQSMVRAMLLEQSEQGWTAGLLYQFPEAAADSSKAAAVLRLSCAEGDTLEQALLAAEQQLPQRANYRLCDYLLVGPGSNLDTLRECEQLFLEQPYARLASRVFCAEFSCAELNERIREEDGGDEDSGKLSAAEQLLRCVKTEADRAPRLYESGSGGCLLPVLKLDDDGTARKEEGILLSQNGALTLTAAQTEAAFLLGGKGAPHAFVLDGQPLIVQHCICSVEVQGDGFALSLTCRCKAGSRPATAAQTQELETLCEQTVQLFWEQGVDLMRLGAVRALRDGNASLTTKNACPPLWTDVKFMG